MKNLEKILLTCFAVGCAEVNQFDTAEDAEVTIKPLNPTEDINLLGYVEDRDEVFEFYWLREDKVYFSEVGNRTLLDKSYTSRRDVWTLQAWVPESSLYPTQFVGSDSVEIE